MMQAREPEPQGAAEWIGTVVGLILAIPVGVGIIALLALPFALPFVLTVVFLHDEPLWWAAVLGLLVALACAVALWAIDAVVKFAVARSLPECRAGGNDMSPSVSAGRPR
jgi:membrane protein YdbS with pleckstrin-like domain